MIIIFIHRGLRPDKELQEIVCERIEQLAKQLCIEVAEVTLERSGPSGSRFTARLHLGTAGQDYSAESLDHTKVGAIDQVLANLSSQFLRSSRDSLHGKSISIPRSVKAIASSWNQSLLMTAT